MESFLNIRIQPIFSFSPDFYLSVGAYGRSPATVAPTRFEVDLECSRAMSIGEQGLDFVVQRLDAVVNNDSAGHCGCYNVVKLDWRASKLVVLA